jgi:glycosyltransferase involved in cell wall biosynthesis
LKILILETKLPVLPEKPGNPRTFCFARELSKKHDVYLLVIPEHDIEEDHLNLIKATEVFKSVSIFKKSNPKRSILRNLLHSLLNKTHTDLSIKDPEYLKEAEEFAKNTFYNTNSDILFSVGIATSQFIDHSLPTVLDLCDSLSLFSSRSLEKCNSLKERFLTYTSYSSFKTLEKDVASKFKNIIFVSEIDRDWFQNLTGHKTSKVVPLGIDLDYFKSDNLKNKKNIISFTGVMDYEPNKDAGHYILNEIFPLIKAQVADSEVQIVGKNADKVGLKCGEAISIRSDVPDIRPYLHSAKLYLCPLRMGAGTKNKLLSAMACKVPIVATPLSIEGMGLIEDEHCLIGKTTEELAEISVILLTNNELRERLSINAYNLATENAWYKVTEMLEKILLTAAQQ